MDIRELRIGNYVYVENKHRSEYKNTPLRVIGIEDDSEEQRLRLQDKDGNTFCQFIKFIAPIPLTEEIIKGAYQWDDDVLQQMLKKDRSINILNEYFGVIQTCPNAISDDDIIEEFNEHNNKDFTGVTVSGLVEITYNFPNDPCVGSHNRSKIKPKYLHQLQNLIFVLSGEELNVEL